jgi:ATP-dependent DNA helicase RecQ
VALMRDQIAAASRAGLRAATINSTNVGEWSGLLDDLRSGSLDVLLISPERLAIPSFAAQLPALLSPVRPASDRRGPLRLNRGFDFQPDDQHCLLTPDGCVRIATGVSAVAPEDPALETSTAGTPWRARRAPDDVRIPVGSECPPDPSGVASASEE